jgi:preprotein translocase subunit Sec63
LSPRYLVHKSASDKDIRAAYKRLSKKYHPDKNKAPDAEDKFVEIARGPLKSLAYFSHHELMLSAAYEVLSDTTVSALLTSAPTQL